MTDNERWSLHSKITEAKRDRSYYQSQIGNLQSSIDDLNSIIAKVEEKLENSDFIFSEQSYADDNTLSIEYCKDARKSINDTKVVSDIIEHLKTIRGGNLNTVNKLQTFINNLNSNINYWNSLLKNSNY